MTWGIPPDVSAYIVMVLTITILLGCVAQLLLLRRIHGPVRRALRLLFFMIAFAYLDFLFVELFGEVSGLGYADVRLLTRVAINIGVWGCYLLFWKLARTA